MLNSIELQNLLDLNSSNSFSFMNDKPEIIIIFYEVLDK